MFNVLTWVAPTSWKNPGAAWNDSTISDVVKKENQGWINLHGIDK